jgi:hypothetical protein
MESSEEFHEKENVIVSRPEWLTYLCIVSFIGSGLAVVSNLFIFFSYDEVMLLKDEINFDFPEFELIMSGGRRFFFAGFILYSFSFFGVYSLFKLRKIGFHLYTVAQLFILVLPVAFIPTYPFSMFSMLITAGFITGYAFYYKIMN